MIETFLIDLKSKKTLNTLEELERHLSPCRLIHDPRPVRWKSKEDALADMALFRSRMLPTRPVMDVEGRPFQLAYFPKAIPVYRGAGDTVRLNPEWLAAPIELRLMMVPDSP